MELIILKKFGMPTVKTTMREAKSSNNDLERYLIGQMKKKKQSQSR